VNLGNPGEYSMKELAEKVIATGGNQQEITYRPLPSDDPKRRKPDISKAQKFLNGWAPTVPLDEGLRLTYGDFKERAEKRPKDLYLSHQKEAQAAFEKSSPHKAEKDDEKVSGA